MKHTRKIFLAACAAATLLVHSPSPAQAWYRGGNGPNVGQGQQSMPARQWVGQQFGNGYNWTVNQVRSGYSQTMAEWNWNMGGGVQQRQPQQGYRNAPMGQQSGMRYNPQQQYPQQGNGYYPQQQYPQQGNGYYQQPQQCAPQQNCGQMVYQGGGAYQEGYFSWATHP